MVDIYHTNVRSQSQRPLELNLTYEFLALVFIPHSMW